MSNTGRDRSRAKITQQRKVSKRKRVEALKQSLKATTAAKPSKQKLHPRPPV